MFRTLVFNISHIHNGCTAWYYAMLGYKQLLLLQPPLLSLSMFLSEPLSSVGITIRCCTQIRCIITRCVLSKDHTVPLAPVRINRLKCMKINSCNVQCTFLEGVWKRQYAESTVGLGKGYFLNYKLVHWPLLMVFGWNIMACGQH